MSIAYPNLSAIDDLEAYTWPEITPPPPSTLLATRQLVKVIGTNATNQSLVLKGIDLDIQRGEFCSSVVAPGSRKSTLLSLPAGLIRASHGDVFINGEAITS